MRKRGWCLPMILLLLLPGCGEKQAKSAPQVQQLYAGLQSCCMQAQVVCQYETESREYSLTCDWSRQGSRVAVSEPAELAGISAQMDENGMKLQYDGLSLSTGAVEGLSPIRCLPQLLQALQSGYVTQESREEVDGVDCLRLALERSGGDGQKVLYTIWLKETDKSILAAELRTGETVSLQCRITEFTFGAQGEAPAT